MTTPRCLAVAAFLVLAASVVPFAIGAKSSAHGQRQATPRRQAVRFDRGQVVKSNATRADEDALVEAIVGLHRSWIALDAGAYASRLAPGITRFSQRLGKVQHGVSRVVADLPSEWEAYERPGGAIALEIAILDASFDVSDDTATALYWIEARGGNKWGFSDQGLIFQAFVRGTGGWMLTYEADSWNLGYNLAKRRPGKETFVFDFAYPTKNLTRAVAFYTPILGEPEVMTRDEAVFNLKGVRFRLDATGLDGHAAIEKGLPNGYAIFHVDDLVAEQKRLEAAGVKFLQPVKSGSGGRSAVAEDIAGNVFVLAERQYTVARGPRPAAPVVRVEGRVPERAAATVKALMSAWLATDPNAVTAITGDDGVWFDDTRTKVRGVARGREEIVETLRTNWARYDHSPAGLLTQMEMNELRYQAVGARGVVSYEMKLTGTGNHPFQETAFVTHVLDAEGRVALTVIAAANRSGAMAIELDYVGYPMADLAAGRKFYATVLPSAERYRDAGWVGFWSDQAVFGLFVARARVDRIPRPHHANGYVSFWVHSAEAVTSHLKRAGSEFPVVPAINERTGVDEQAGYRQVYATDSEGNGVIFTEYTGKR